MLSTFFLICLHGIAAAVELGLDARQNYQQIGGKQEHSEIAVREGTFLIGGSGPGYFRNFR